MVLMASAPEHADTLLRLAVRLPPEELDGFVFRWIDRCVRVHVPTALERIERREDAEALRGLSELRDRPNCLRAYSILARAAQNLGSAESEMDTMAGIFGLMAAIDDDFVDDGALLEGVIIGIVTSARCVGAWHEERDQIADLMAVLA